MPRLRGCLDSRPPHCTEDFGRETSHLASACQHHGICEIVPLASCGLCNLLVARTLFCSLELVRDRRLAHAPGPERQVPMRSWVTWCQKEKCPVQDGSFLSCGQWLACTLGEVAQRSWAALSVPRESLTGAERTSVSRRPSGRYLQVSLSGDSRMLGCLVGLCSEAHLWCESRPVAVATILLACGVIPLALTSESSTDWQIKSQALGREQVHLPRRRFGLVSCLLFWSQIPGGLWGWVEAPVGNRGCSCFLLTFSLCDTGSRVSCWGQSLDRNSGLADLGTSVGELGNPRGTGI